MSLEFILNHYAAHIFDKRQYGIVGKRLDSRPKPYRFKSHLCAMYQLIKNMNCITFPIFIPKPAIKKKKKKKSTGFKGKSGTYMNE